MLRKSLITSGLPREHSEMAFVRHQAGVTLVELMVGITIGMLIVAVAMGAVIVSRGATTTVSEAAQLQQQASYAFRVLGQQIRQAGSLELNLDVETGRGTEIDLSPNTKVAFQVGYNQWSQIINGVDAPSATEFALSVGHQNYAERLTGVSKPGSLFRDCLGEGGPATSSGSANFPRIISRFALRGNELVCSGVGGQPQAIIQDVADFQVRYYVQAGAASGTPTIQRALASEVTNWADVIAVEVCLDMVGSRPVDVPADSRYMNCQNTQTSYGNRLHQVYRNVFQLRSQGVLG